MPPRVSVTKRFTFDASHQLTRDFGKCCNMHGHTFILEVTIEGHVHGVQCPVVVDFSRLKELVQSEVLDHLDHFHLNHIDWAAYYAGDSWEKFKPLVLDSDGVYPTAEVMVLSIAKRLSTKLEQQEWHTEDLRITEVKLHETPNSWATWRYSPESGKCS